MSTENNGCLNVVSAGTNSSKDEECVLEHEEVEDEDEEGDFDFNPFLKETASVEEASSSLSSEVEGLEYADVADSGGNTCCLPPLESNKLLPKAPDSELKYYGEEVVMQTAISSAGGSESLLENALSTGCKKRTLGVNYESENAPVCEKEDGSGIATDFVYDVTSVDIGNNVHSNKLVVDMDDEDAICRRTRAHYSLASFTLDELETFLQETDDEGDLHSFDDEEEYRKFLAAVLLDGNSNSGAVQGNEIVDDEDEDNDADFELEIEEALESDVDENIRDEIQEREYVAVGRRPETRHNKRRKASLKHEKKISGPQNRPLRPILPYAPIAPFPPLDLRHMMIEESAPHCLPSSTQAGFVNIFTPHQIGQLHCLIHEHVQLLVQVFSLCVLEPSQQHIATGVQGLLSELLHKRDQLLALKSISYPSFCFCPPYIHPSVQDECPQNLPAQSTFEYSAYDAQRVMKGYFWMPFISGPVLSVVDVAPLKLVGSYMDDVSNAVHEHRARLLAGTYDSCSAKESLFPFKNSEALAEANVELSRRSISPASKTAHSPGSDLTCKKTIAAALVERTKKQSVAPVYKEISKLAQRFFPLFNPALFPHKPPPMPVANRVLFTDAEDGLLARGLMEFNMDWKQIQEHFLPCKSKHQIFVRQKNRSCSRAPENPIKAVRRMKTSPLTVEEKVRIEEGLKLFKYDWMSICKYIVPHRDPSLLPRQWRTAIGTQKSYKADEAKNARRRVYESMRRDCKFANLAGGQTPSDKEDRSTGNACGENNSGDDCLDNEDEAYVHQAFLADWRPGTSSEQIKNIGSIDSQPQLNNEFPASFKHKQLHHTSSHSVQTVSSVRMNYPVSNASRRSAQSKFSPRPYRTRRTDNSRLVKLAPDLPPVNLPPTVRVMSQSAFKNYREEIYSRASAANQGSSGPAEKILARPCAMNSGTSHLTEATKEKRNAVVHSSSRIYLQNHAEENDESDLHMHPLLFQAPGNGSLPYYQLNCSAGASSSFNFFPKYHPQVNVGLFHTTQHVKQTVTSLSNSLKFKGLSTSSSGIDFHPLLQRTDDANSDLMAAPSVAQPSSTSELLTGPLVQPADDVVMTDSRTSTTPMATTAIPSSPNSRANELDLDIHLSFKIRKEKGGQSKDVDKQTVARSFAEVQETRALGISSRDVDRNNMNETANNSRSEIVMEQEELSDSEEEMGENVEFECEEMADSEGEGESDSDQTDNIPNKDFPAVSVEKVLTQADDNDPHEPMMQGIYRSNIHGCSEGSVNFGTIDCRKDNPSTSSSLCLSLNSFAPPLGKAEKLPVTRNRRGSHLGQPSNSTAPQQLHLDTLAVVPLRKPRNRPQKKSRSSTARARKRDSGGNAAAAQQSPQSC